MKEFCAEITLWVTARNQTEASNKVRKIMNTSSYIGGYAHHETLETKTGD